MEKTMDDIRKEALELLKSMNELPYSEYRYQDDDTKRRYDSLNEALRKFDGE